MYFAIIAKQGVKLIVPNGMTWFSVMCRWSGPWYMYESFI